jgi:IMP cyclohydrolase
MIHTSGLLSALEYPGRFIIIGAGRESGEVYVVYAITGRSVSSQARKLVVRDGGIWVQPTDEEALKKGNADLLVYPAVLFHDRGLAVSNGRQTLDIRDRLEAAGNPQCALAEALDRWDYEPDAPIYTPRISGCVMGDKAALSLVRRGPGGETLRGVFAVGPAPRAARFVSTYLGPNREPLPCFEGEPLVTSLDARAPEEAAESVYESLRPRAEGKDFRVAVACIAVSPADPRRREAHIINRHERT